MKAKIHHIIRKDPRQRNELPDEVVMWGDASLPEVCATVTRFCFMRIQGNKVFQQPQALSLAPPCLFPFLQITAFF
jgi:hypothetical protein